MAPSCLIDTFPVFTHTQPVASRFSCRRSSVGTKAWPPTRPCSASTARAGLCHSDDVTEAERSTVTTRTMHWSLLLLSVCGTGDVSLPAWQRWRTFQMNNECNRLARVCPTFCCCCCCCCSGQHAEAWLRRVNMKTWHWECQWQRTRKRRPFSMFLEKKSATKLTASNCETWSRHTERLKKEADFNRTTQNMCKYLEQMSFSSQRKRRGLHPKICPSFMLHF